MQPTRELFDNTVADGQSQPGSLADLLESAPALAGSNMAAIFALKCSSCDEIHEGSPSFAFRAPDPFLKQAKAVQDAGKLGSDLCWYDDEDGRHFFVRVCREVPIHGVSEPFTWGVWISLSEASFNRYDESYDSPDPSDAYFGWFSNYLPYYKNTYTLKTFLRPRVDGIRPYLALEKTDHPL